MLRIFVLGLVLVGLALGLRNQWIEVNWGNLLNDAGLPGQDQSEPFDFQRWLIGDPKKSSP